MKFTVFSDYHYDSHIDMYGLDGLNKIFKSAFCNNSEFIVHAGDLCHDYGNSPQLMKAYLKNEYGIPVYGAYGNHDNESPYTCLSFVTKCLTNDENVVWGTSDGAFDGENVTYYYVDKGKFRFIFTDTNHHFFVDEGVIKHTPAGMGEAPIKNTPRHLLGLKQLAWLEKVLLDAAKKNLSCITVSHAGFGRFDDFYKVASGPSDDTKKVRELFNKVNKIKPHTVIMCINGHYHLNHLDVDDGILFFDVNSAMGTWSGKPKEHNKDVMFNYLVYDNEGNLVSSTKKSALEIPAIEHRWFMTEPLYAHVTVTDDFKITIEGRESSWVNGEIPPAIDGVMDYSTGTKISSGEFKL